MLEIKKLLTTVRSVLLGLGVGLGMGSRAGFDLDATVEALLARGGVVTGVEALHI